LSAEQWDYRGITIKEERADCEECIPKYAFFDSNLDEATKHYKVFQPLEILGGRSILDMFHQ
jgi:hypothetical protein